MDLTPDSRKNKKKKRHISANSIPIVVDNIVYLPEYDMVRFIYYSIDAEDNPKSYKLKIGNRGVPFLLIEFQGIIHSPLTGLMFRTAHSIGQLFESIEKTGDFFVDINDIWLPVSIFSATPVRGDVYRITTDLFGLALKYRNDKIEKESFVERAELHKDQIFLSSYECKAFNEWSLSVIQEAIEIYPKNSELKLEYLETVE